MTNTTTLSRAAVSTALWRLRQILEPPPIPRGTYLTCPSACEVGFDGTSDFHLDTLAFEDRAKQSLNTLPADLQPVDVQAIEEAISLYRTDLAEQCQHPWVLGERERLRNLYLSCQEHLMNYYASCALHDRIVEYGQRILENDPFREEIHRQVMRSYLATGQRSLALRQYSRCRQALAVYLNSEPMDETRALLHQTGSLWDKAERLSGEAPWLHDDTIEVELKVVCQQLANAVRTLREVEQKVEAATRRLDAIAQYRSAAKYGAALSGGSYVAPT